MDTLFNLSLVSIADDGPRFHLRIIGPRRDEALRAAKLILHDASTMANKNIMRRVRQLQATEASPCFELHLDDIHVKIKFITIKQHFLLIEADGRVDVEVEAELDTVNNPFADFDYAGHDLGLLNLE
ncbi:hypothetical protein EYR40_002556 [Pleurotus pulmonarius]|nr:hypothetical protein EYR40_002556 [Pleurotus pulmonarius]KAF4600408.1 hypothetical protein EYR38_005035 [Pleurotus pulmonarius]